MMAPEDSPHPYGDFLNGFNPSDPRVSAALADVQSSGLSPETLQAAGVKLFNGTTEELKKRLGFSRIDGQPILKSHHLIEYPYPSETGKPVRWEYKPHPPVHFAGQDKHPKYLQGKGAPPVPYITAQAWTVKGKPSHPLWITEGVKKALKLNQHGRAAISLSGVWNFRGSDTGPGTLWADLEAFAWKGRTVLLGFDADLWNNPSVRLALFTLAFTLHLRGALLSFPEWPEGKGIDDFLQPLQDPARALKEIEGGALPIGDFLTMEHRGEILAALEHLPPGALQTIHGRTLLTQTAEALNMKPKDLTADLKTAQAARERREADQGIYPFFIKEGGVHMWRRGRDGIEYAHNLSDFWARIIEDVTIDDGLETTRRFTIEGGKQGSTFPPIRVATDTFKGLGWVVRHWGNDAILRSGQTTQDNFREFIQVYSARQGVLRKNVFAHTGWRQEKGKWVYLHAAGCLGDDTVSVELPGDYITQGRYCLPREPQNEAEAIRAALDFLTLSTKPEIMYPLFGYTFLSVLTSVLSPPPAFLVYLYGEKDSFKSTLAALCLAFFGIYSKAGLANFDSTANALMKRAAILKDTLLVVDDYYPGHRQKDAQARESLAQRIIRDVGNRTGRGRLNSDTTEKPTPYPRGGVIITGELLPELQSTLSRIVAIELQASDLDLNRLSALQDKAPLLPSAMTSFITWLQPRIGDIQAAFPVALADMRRRGAIEGSRKLPEHGAYLQYALELLLQWAVDKKAMTESDRKWSINLAWLAIQRALDVHGKRVEGEDPARFFFEIVGSLLAQGKARMDHRHSGYDRDATIGGHGGELIGYYDGEFYYLLPAPVWLSVTTRLRLSGDTFPFNKGTLYDVLAKRGFLETNGDRSFSRQRIKGQLTTVLKIRRDQADRLMGLEPGEEEPMEEACSL